MRCPLRLRGISLGEFASNPEMVICAMAGDLSGVDDPDACVGAILANDAHESGVLHSCFSDAVGSEVLLGLCVIGCSGTLGEAGIGGAVESSAEASAS